MICTTLNKIRALGPCEDGLRKLLKHLGKTEADDEPLPLLTLLDSNGLDDCLRCLRSVPEHDREWRLFAVWCARKVQHLMTDPRSIAALDVAEWYANGEATAEELDAAWYSAWDAAWDPAWDAAVAAAGSRPAGDAAKYAAKYAAWAASWYSAGDAARDAARDAQKQELIRIITTDSSTLAGG
jgi:hypothetical protein